MGGESVDVMPIRDGLGICGFLRHEVTTNIVGDLAACLINYLVIRNLKTELITQKNRRNGGFSYIGGPSGGI